MNDLRRRLDLAITIATNEATVVDTDGIQSEGMRYAFEKMHQQWVFVRDVLIDIKRAREDG